MSQSLLLHGAKQLLTLRGEPGLRRGSQSGNLALIEDGSVFIQDGKIASVGSSRRLENLKEIRGATRIAVQGCVIMPGFIDASLEMSLGTPGHLGVGRQKRPSANDFYNRTLTLMRSCLQHGTLNAAVRAVCGLHAKGDVSVLRQLARIGNNPVGLCRTWCPPLDMPDPSIAFKRQMAEFLLFRPGDPRVRETADADFKWSLDWTGGSTEDLGEALHRSTPSSIFCRHELSLEDRQLLANSKAAAVFKAGSALLDRHSEAHVRELIDEGGGVVLGSGYDGAHEANFNMQLVLAFAVRRLNLKIEEAIVAATINAAYAMDRGSQIGSLEPGKRADVLVLSLPDYREIPRRLGVNHVAMVIRNGEIVSNRTKWRLGAA